MTHPAHTLTDDRIGELYEQATSYALGDDDYPGVRAFVQAIEAEFARRTATQVAPAAAPEPAMPVLWVHSTSGYKFLDPVTNETLPFNTKVYLAAPVHQVAATEPSGYAYEYQSFDGRMIRFNNGQEVNGCKPSRAVPYWFAAPVHQVGAAGPEGLAWAVAKWASEVQNRPLVNVHRRTLDDTWRQVIRYFGGDPAELVGPAHDDLLAGQVGAAAAPSPAPIAYVRVIAGGVSSLSRAGGFIPLPDGEHALYATPPAATREAPADLKPEHRAEMDRLSDAAVAQFAADQANAKRYLWLRDVAWNSGMLDTMCVRYGPEDWDQHIDGSIAAMSPTHPSE